MTDTITLPREVVEKAVKAFENGCPPTCENGMIDSGGFHPWGQPALVPCPACLAFEHLRTHLAAEQPVPTDKDSLTVQSRLDAESFREERDEARALLNGVLQDIEALRRDAERYEWPKAKVEDYDGHACFPQVPYPAPIPDCSPFDAVDAAIDAAMKEDKT